jgi:hypothetical protein
VSRLALSEQKHSDRYSTFRSMEVIMKFIKTLLAAAMAALLGGCAVYPAGHYGSPRPAYYQPGPYYGPVAGVGVYGGWHHGYR